MKQAIIHFKNGTKDWVDPIDDEEKDIFYGNATIIITNGANQRYVYDRDSVSIVEIVNID